MNIARTLIVAVVATVFAGQLCAEDLGVKGLTYKLDRDAREQMKSEIRAKERSGELARFWEQYRERTVESIKHPQPLGLRTDYTSHSATFEARYVIAQDYRDNKGKVIAAKGTVVEPLKLSPLQTGLVFIDGRDQRQIDYALAWGRKAPMKIVLTAGSPYELRVRYRNEPWRGSKGVPFYFDQRKYVLNSLERLYGIQISSVPAVLQQQRDKLAVLSGMNP